MCVRARLHHHTVKAPDGVVLVVVLAVVPVPAVAGDRVNATTRLFV